MIFFHKWGMPCGYVKLGTKSTSTILGQEVAERVLEDVHVRAGYIQFVCSFDYTSTIPCMSCGAGVRLFVLGMVFVDGHVREIYISYLLFFYINLFYFYFSLFEMFVLLF